MPTEVQSLRVVIAEDDLFVSELIRAELNELGATVLGHAGNGQVAVELTCRLKPDVVLMDVQMPQMDGIEATARIQECCPTPVVVLTAHADRKMASRAARAGAGAYLVKPAAADALLRAITVARARFDDLMELRRLNSELQQALDKVKTLKGLLPICSNCKKIRDDHGYWRRVEAYIQDHSAAQFTHGICPDCMDILYPMEGNPWRKQSAEDR